MAITVNPSISGGGSATGGGAVSSVAGRTGDVVLSSTDVGLTNVNNTSDANKPVSTAQAAAISTKALAMYTNPVPGTGISAQTLANTVATRKLRAGTKPGRIILLGDSFLAGFTSGDAGMGNVRANAIAAKLALMLTGRGIRANNDWASGYPDVTSGAGTAANIAAYDPRLSITTTASPSVIEIPAVGGYPIALTATNDLIHFTPGVPFDTIEIIHARNTSGSGNFTVSLDGGTTTLQTVTDNTAIDVFKTVIAVPANTVAKRVTIKRGTGSNYIMLVGVRHTGSPTVDVINIGSTGAQLQFQAIAGTTTGDANSWNIRRGLPVVADGTTNNLVLIEGWYNDRVTGGRSTAQVQADMTTLITAGKAVGDVMVIDYAAADPAIMTPAVAAPYRAAVAAAASAASVPIIKMSDIITDYTVGNAQGLYGDQLHLNGVGNAYAAGAIVEAITNSILV